MIFDGLIVARGRELGGNEPEIARYVLDWGKKDDQSFAAVDETSLQPIGAVWIRLFAADNKGYGYLGDNIPELSIALLPAYRNRGIGTALLKRLFEDVGLQYPALSLSVSSDNPAVRLYQRLGLEVV